MSITKNHERLQNSKVFTGQLGYMGYVFSKPEEITEGVGVIEIGIDAGSTSTRWLNFDSETGEESDTLELDSDCGIVSDISHLKSDSSKIYDNLEIEIKDVTLSSAKPERMFDEIHIIKGGLRESKPSTNLKRASRESKVKLVATYVNIISAMAVDALVDIHESGVALECYKFVPSIALPPEDFKSDIIQARFKNNLAGRYKIKFNRLNVEFDIVIKAEDIYLEKESDAVIYNIIQTRDEELDGSTFVMDGGGKSTDKSVIRDGVLVKDASDTSKYGGMRLLKAVAAEYVRRTGNTEPNLTAILNSLVDGNLVKGNVVEPIIEIIEKAKFDLATSLYNDFLETLDVAEMSVDELSNLVLHGRLFTPTLIRDSEGNVLKSISISAYLIDMIKKLNPQIKTFVELETFNICRGVLISRLIDEAEE